MKVLISDYSSEYSTEPLYFNAALNSVNCTSTLWNHNTSTFDAFDINNPDIYITHHSRLTKDLVLYLQENKNKVDIIINVTGLEQKQLIDLEKAFEEYGSIPALFFTNYYNNNLQSKKTRLITIPHGADLFLSTDNKQYDIDYCIIIDNEDQLKPIGQTYHYITTNPKLHNIADICLPINQLNHLYKNYKSVVFRYFNDIIPQSFFDAGCKNDSVFFDIEDRTYLDQQLKSIFGNENVCDITDTNTGNIKEQILNKHTCLHRTKSLISQFSKQYTENLQSLIDKNIKHA